ncbi:putative N-acetyltransferase ycf52-like protein [Podospora fimiseda]|uniref:N-acetyltransferase ycf52-like protein n=1 Tax=Podospora fimiseda TaxID=252190 RepID=A0AAN7BHZ0_9PEZI|nr:putative N-acetyltransferase ycf52-like protein [Podospora fimiseda]
MFIRRATYNDLEAMSRVIIGASPLDPIYPYRFPDRHLYPDQFSALCREKCAEYLATSTVVVCEMPSISCPSTSVVVAFASWDTPDSRRQIRSGKIEPYPASSPAPIPVTIGHKDRMAAFRSTCAEYKQKLFDSVYPEHRGGHVMLKILLCHPDYQKQGAGTALTKWGIDLAARLGLCTTVFASPMGLNLYRKLGFKEIHKFKVQLPGDKEYLVIPALVLEPKRVEQGVQMRRHADVAGYEFGGGLYAAGSAMERIATVCG